MFFTPVQKLQIIGTTHVHMLEVLPHQEWGVLSWSRPWSEHWSARELYGLKAVVERYFKPYTIRHFMQFVKWVNVSKC